MRLVLDAQAEKTQACHSGSTTGSGRASPLHAIQKIGNGRLANRFDDGVRRLPRLAGQPRDEFAPHSAERFHGVGVVEPNAGLRRFPALSRPHPSSGSRSTSDSSFRSYVVPVT